MTEKQALLAAIFVMSDAIDEFHHTDYYESDDPWLLEIKEAQAKLKKCLKGRYNIMLTCPYCHKELWYDDMNDEYNNGNHVYQYWNGHCPECSRNFKWTERYDFVYFYDLEEEKELE